jgi:hypothetical protein
MIMKTRLRLYFSIFLKPKNERKNSLFFQFSGQKNRVDEFFVKFGLGYSVVPEEWVRVVGDYYRAIGD